MAILFRAVLFSFIFVLASCGGGGGSSSDGNAGTVTPDTTPNNFSFADETDVALLAEIESNIVTISGINTPTPVSIVNGEYSINGGAFTNASGTINNNQQIIVRQISSDLFSTVTNTELSVGGVSDTFSLTTVSEDIIANPFSFTDQSDAPLNTIIESNTVVITGINSPVSVAITGGEYSIDGASFTNATGTVSNGQSIKVRHTSSSSPSNPVSTMLNVGGIIDVFTSRTVIADVDPDDFNFAAVNGVIPNSFIISNPIIVSGINSAALVQVDSNSRADFSINNGPFSSTPRIVVNGGSIKVRLQASQNFSSQVFANLTIGSVTRSFLITTTNVPAPDTTPNPFSFFDQTNTSLSSLGFSNFISISGIDAATPVSISGGEYSIEFRPFTNSPGIIFNGQRIRVRHTSSANFSTTTNTVLTIGGVSDTFSITTFEEDTTPFTFSFVDQLGVNANAIVNSNTVFISGINSASPVSIVGGEYSINGGVFTSASGTVSNGQNIQVRQTSSSLTATKTDAVLTVGGISDTFSVTTAGTDVTPDQFSFVDQTQVRTNFSVTSNVVTLTGTDSPANISITNGEYSINFGPFTSSAGTIGVNQSVRVRQTSSPNFSTNTDAILTIGGVSDTFSVTTEAEDTTPNSFNFFDSTNVPLNTLVTSSTTFISGFNSPAPISISGGQYSINFGPFTSTPGTFDPNQNIRVQVNSSPNVSTTTGATVTIGGVSDTFNVTTITTADTTPNIFTFSDRTNFPINTLVRSNTQFVSGINTPAPISIVGGEYSINNGVFTSAPGTIAQNQTVAVRQTSSANFSTTTDTTLTIGDVSDTFSVTTQAEDSTPFAFFFSSRTNIPVNTLITSGSASINGINIATPISIVGGEYSISGGLFTSSPGTINGGQNVRVRQTSSANFSTTTSTVLTVGDVSGTFSVTTESLDTTPNNFVFLDQTEIAIGTLTTSNSILVTGINSLTPISIGNGEFSIDGGAFTSSAGTIDAGQSVVVRLTSSPLIETTTDAVLTIGGVSDTFSVTTETADTSPDIFSFLDQTDIELSTLTSSNSVSITGINVATAVTISGGEFSIDGAPFTNSSSVITNGQNIVVRQISSASTGSTTNAVLTIGGVSDTFSVTTSHPPGTTPDPFSFTDQVDVPLNDPTTSDTVTITGITVDTTISIINGEYEIDGGGFTNLPSTILAGQQVTVRQTSAKTFSTTTDTVLTIGPVSDTFSVTTLSTHPVVINQELTITDLSVVESVHADPGGHWTFEHLITEMMPQTNPTAQEKSDFVLNWLSHWTSIQTVNGFNIGSRQNMQNQVINPWIAASGGTGVLDLSVAPFRLLAIVNRIDLAQRDINGNVLNAGEGRFVFGVLGPSGASLQFTVIFEYGLPATSEEELNQWILDWHNLSLNNFSNINPAYNDALLAVTDKFTSKNAAPSKPNGSALNQLRSNEIALSSPWELREFNLSPSTGDLAQVTVKENPDFFTINNSTLLRDFVNQNEQAIIDRTISIPDTFNGQPFLGGSAINFGGSGAIFRATGIVNNEARHQLSLNTCSGCHGGETGTSFLHIFPRSLGQESNLSGFLRGSFNGLPLTVRDPVDFSTTREFFDLDGRKNNLECLLNGCSVP